MDLIKENYFDEEPEVPHKKLKVSNDNEKTTKNNDLKEENNEKIPENSVNQNENNCESYSRNSATCNIDDPPISPTSSENSKASESDWQPPSIDAMKWVQEKMLSGIDPREILKVLTPDIEPMLSQNIDTFALWKLLVKILSEPKRREKLPDVNTFEDTVNLIKNSKKILVLTGAGVSVSCGIPDFRSRDGVYARLAVDFPDLPNPEAMFDIGYFKHDPRPFFKFAKEIYPGQFKPSLIHRFISHLEKSGRLLRNYTQNIDTLEQVAGINKVIQCHGSFATASCQKCHHKVDCEAIRQDIFNQIVPHCTQCSDEDPGILKPDIVFFGENLPDHFHQQISEDKDEVDLLIVIGSTLKVRPVALIPNSVPSTVPQILINRESLQHLTFDVELLGDGDIIIGTLCEALGDQFLDLCEKHESLKEITELPQHESSLNLNNNAQNSNTNCLQTKTDNAMDTTTATEENPTTCNDKTLTDNDTSLVLNLDANQHVPEIFKKSGPIERLQHNRNQNQNEVETTNSQLNIESKIPTKVKLTDIIQNECSVKNDQTCLVQKDLSATQNISQTPNCENSKNFVENSNLNSGEDKILTKNNTDSPKAYKEETSLKNQTLAENNGTLNVVHDNTKLVENQPLIEDKIILNEDSKDVDQEETNEDLEMMRGMWKSKWKQSISSRIPPGCYYYNKKHRYIFPGAEIIQEEYSSDEESSIDNDSNSSTTTKPQQPDNPCCSTSIQNFSPVCDNLANS